MHAQRHGNDRARDDAKQHARPDFLKVICPTGKKRAAAIFLSSPSRKNFPLGVLPKSNL
jgi:hypothetical protein